jgi:hypothetical protein
MMTADVARRRVERGARFNDRRFGPDWHNKIDTKTLVMTDCRLCVWGQLYGNWGLRPLLSWAIARGVLGSRSEYPMLHRAWLAEIDRRRRRDSLSDLACALNESVIAANVALAEVTPPPPPPEVVWEAIVGREDGKPIAGNRR